jgi:hypothetical protein
MWQFLAQCFILLVDDYDDPEVFFATQAALKAAPPHTIHLTREIRGGGAGEYSHASWWNGLGLFLIEKKATSSK